MPQNTPNDDLKALQESVLEKLSYVTSNPFIITEVKLNDMIIPLVAVASEDMEVGAEITEKDSILPLFLVLTPELTLSLTQVDSEERMFKMSNLN